MVHKIRSLYKKVATFFSKTLRRERKKELGTEVERKWRLERVPEFILNSCTSAEILQGYILINDDGEVRLRKEARKYFLTFKGEGTISRPEENYALQGALGFSLLWRTIIGDVIEKDRYRYVTKTGVFEIDVFKGYLQGLVLMEMEFSDIASAEAFELPTWASGALEVTSDKRYKNKNLALKAATVREELRF